MSGCYVNIWIHVSCRPSPGVRTSLAKAELNAAPINHYTCTKYNQIMTVEYTVRLDMQKSLYLKYLWFRKENIHPNESLKAHEDTHALKLSARGKTTLSWTVERRLIVIYSEGEIAHKHFTKIGCCVTVKKKKTCGERKSTRVRWFCWRWTRRDRWRRRLPGRQLLLIHAIIHLFLSPLWWAVTEMLCVSAEQIHDLPEAVKKLWGTIVLYNVCWYSLNVVHLNTLSQIWCSPVSSFWKIHGLSWFDFKRHALHVVRGGTAGGRRLTASGSGPQLCAYRLFIGDPRTALLALMRILVLLMPGGWTRAGCLVKTYWTQSLHNHNNVHNAFTVTHSLLEGASWAQVKMYRLFLRLGQGACARWVVVRLPRPAGGHERIFSGEQRLAGKIKACEQGFLVTACTHKRGCSDLT